MLTYDTCTLCPWECHANRTTEERGFCKMGSTPMVARAALHFWEEPCISGTSGSGTIFFSGCSMRCVYCQNQEISRGQVGIEITEERLEELCWMLKDQGAHNINLVTPTHFLPSIQKVLMRLKKQSFPLPFVYNTSGYERVEVLKELEGLVDIYLTDYRYTEMATAKAYSETPSYPLVVFDALQEMVRQTGPSILDEYGMMQKGTIIRFLLLPEHVEEAQTALDRAYHAFGESVYYSLMQQYVPCGENLPLELKRRITPLEYKLFVKHAENLGIEHAYTQERDSAEESFIPPFDYTGLI